MKKFIISILLITVFFQNIIAQEAEASLEPQAASSNASAGLYSGKPSINIPLWNCKARGVSIPISLSYNTSGIKVSDEASWVGLGWSLNAGGAITRVVKDLPDDIVELKISSFNGIPTGYNISYIGWLYGEYTYPNDDFPNGDISYEDTQAKLVYDFNPSDYVNNYDADSDFSNLTDQHGWETERENDTEPDIFYFNFCGRSGSFVFDKGSNDWNDPKPIRMITYQDLLIEYTYTPGEEITSFTITDENGTKYFFEDIEYSYSVVAYLDPDPGYIAQRYILFEKEMEYVSGWFLSKIITSFNEEITFEYNYERIISGFLEEPTLYNESYINIINNSYDFLTPGKLTDSRKLTKIESDYFKIEFISDDENEREDLMQSTYLGGLYSCKTLNNINIYSKIDDTFEAVKEYTFFYDYFESPEIDANNCDDIYYYRESYKKRLKLNSLQVSNNGKSLPPYIFSYDYESEIRALPMKAAYQKDFWGYYNGNTEAQNLKPTIYIHPDLEGNARFRLWPKEGHTYSEDSIIEGTDRTPNADLMTIGTLNCIETPMGGKTIYTYEPHEFFYDGQNYTGGGIRIKSIEKIDAVNNINEKREYKYTYSDNPDISSGKIITLPVYAYYNPLKGEINFNYDDDIEPYCKITVYNLSDFSDGVIGYEEVTEIIGSETNENIGKIVYEFSMPAAYGDINDPVDGLFETTAVNWISKEPEINHDNLNGLIENMISGYHSYPFPQNTNYGWNRGQLKTKTEYDTDDNKVRKFIYEYNIFSKNGSTPIIISGIKTNMLDELYLKAVQPVFVYGKYDILTEMKKILTSKNVIIYDQDDNSKYSSTFSFYFYNNFGQISEIKTVDSEGLELKKQMKYSRDYSVDPDLITTNTIYNVFSYMLDNHIINIPIETVTLKNNEVISANLNIFKKNLNIAGEFQYNILHYQSFILETNQTLIDFNNSYFDASQNFVKDTRYSLKTTSDVHDNFGNTLQSHTENNYHISKILGYNSNLTIAEVTNAEYNEIAYTSFESSDHGNWNYTDNSIESIISVTGSKYHNFTSGTIVKSNIVAGSYKLTFWAKEYAGAPNITGTNYTIVENISSVANANGWKLYEIKIDFSSNGSELTINSGFYIDELRFYPADANMATYTYNINGIKSKTDINNISIFYEYDDFGRLTIVRDQDGNILKKTEFVYSSSD
ncbi:MAG: hypothetical protein KAT68_18590 [Bacteroidales bacterium]|nr:hypothetical protein [Bacteroidales bacterium]